MPRLQRDYSLVSWWCSHVGFCTFFYNSLFSSRKIMIYILIFYLQKKNILNVTRKLCEFFDSVLTEHLLCTQFNMYSCKTWASLVAQMVKNLPAMWETQVWSCIEKIPWRREWQPTPVFLSGESHGQRSLESYSPWGGERVGHDWVNNTHTWAQ